MDFVLDKLTAGLIQLKTIIWDPYDQRSELQHFNMSGYYTL